MKRDEHLRNNVEGKRRKLRPSQVPAIRPLLEVLREGLGYTGPKRGCDTGSCGACAVLLDGEPVLSCLVLAVAANRREVSAVEGLTAHGQLHTLQVAFIEEGAVQCGFCTPGMLVAAYKLLQEKPIPTEVEIREALAGNLCRCTGYARIIAAVQRAAACGASAASGEAK